MSFEQDLLEILPRLRRFARSLTKNDWEDLVQDTLIRAMRNQHQFTPGTNLAAWVCFIAKNCFLSQKRRAWRSVELDEEATARIPIHIAPDKKIELELVLELISTLPKDMQTALYEVALCGGSYEEAAINLGIAEGTVKSKVSRARKTLKDCFP